MLKLKHPFTAVVSGPTSSGKSLFCLRLIENVRHMIEPVPSKIVWHYGIYQPKFHKSSSVIEFKKGLPTLDEEDDENTPTLMILDDLMNEVNDEVVQIFTRGSHHRNISVIYITQNIFQQSRHSRTINLNSHYLVLFKNPRDVTQIAYLGRQMYPQKSNFLVDAFKDATSKPYGYLFLDLKPETEEQYRVRTDIFPDDDHRYVYVPNRT